ncbi:MAG TPA: FHA domain-containing protein, partial [Pseudomonadales bacterium]|nr:FHA domain-containing protein [Pseudomonadales bacterium]
MLSIGGHELTVSVRGAPADRSAGTAAKWQLILDDDVASVQLSGDVVVGSEADCGIRLPEGDIAAHHAQLVLREGTLWLRDLSDGATFVNDEPVRGACRVEPDDRVQIGPHRFRAARQALAAVEPVAPPAATPAPSDLDALCSEVPVTRDLPMAADPRETLRPEMPVAGAVEKPVSVAPVAETPVPEVPVSVAPVAKTTAAEVPVSVPPVAKTAAPEVPVSMAPAAKAPVREVPPSVPPAAKKKPVAKKSVARRKPATEAPAAAKPEPVWELDSLELPAADIHFELVEPETPRAVPEPIPIPQQAVPPRVLPRAVAPERRVASARVEPRVSMGQAARARAAEPKARRTVLWRVAGLLLVLTLAWAVAMRPPAYDGLVGRAFEGWPLADARDRAVATVRAVETAIIDRWHATVANRTASTSESASVA